MLVIDIMMKVIRQGNERRHAQQPQGESAMGSFDVQIGKVANGYLPVSLQGGLPSSTTVALKHLSSIGLGYGMGQGIYSESSTDDYGKSSSLLETGAISATASVAAVILEYYLYSTYFGTALPKTVIELPVQMRNESDDAYRKRGKAWLELQGQPNGLDTSLGKLVEGLIGAAQMNTMLWMLTALASGYHGYKRHDNSIGMLLGWALFGNTGLAVAQGYAKPLPPKK